MTWLKAHAFDALIWLVLGVAGLMSGLWASTIILDDALITFRVAENLAAGRGFVFNMGERVQVTTTPLYAMILAVSTWIFGSAAQAALILNLSFAALIPIFAYQVGRLLAGRITGFSAGALLTLAPLLIIAFSMESYLYVALILASMWAYLAERLRLAGILVGLTALVRGDAVSLGACLLTYDFLAQRLRFRWSLIIPAVGIPALWYLFATLYYGNPFPATLGAKVAQGEFDWLGQGFLDGLYENYIDRWIRGEDWDLFYLFLPLASLGLLVILWRERQWLILVGRDVLYVSVFVYLAVPSAEWYYAPLMPGIALLTGRGIQVIADGVKIISDRLQITEDDHLAQVTRNGAILALLLFPLLYVSSLAVQLTISDNPDWKAQAYPDIARWIAKNTNSSANFATIDIGHLGYWSERQIIDIVGLAQPDVGLKIAEGDFGYAIQEYDPDMVLIGFSWLPEIQSQPWFQAEYIPRHQFLYHGQFEPFILFSQRDGVKVQPETVPLESLTPLDINFNQQIKLLGYHHNQHLGPGSPLNLTLLWETTAPIEVDFTIFVQLVDDTNTVIAQRDTKPQDGFYTTPHWQPSEQIVDVHVVPLPTDIPSGTYAALIGFYEAESGSRLQILDEAGQFKSDYVRLSGIVVDGL